MASRYYVGSGSNWDDIANWSDTSGGSGGFSIPTSSDNVFFDANSGSCVVDVDAYCADLDFTGYTSTFSGSKRLYVYGSFELSASMSMLYDGWLTFAATTTGKTLTFNGITTGSTFTFNGIGGGWTLQDAWNNGTDTVSVVNGSLDFNNVTFTGSFTSNNSNTRSITLGTSTLNVVNFQISSTNLTFSGASSTINLSGSSSNPFLGGGQIYGTVTFNKSFTGILIITGANTFSNLTITGGSNKTQTYAIRDNQTITGTLTITGNSATNRLLIQSETLGTAKTITAATTTLSNCDFMDITGAGAGSWSGTSIGNALGNSGITFTTPVTRYAVTAGNWSSTGTWSATSGGVSGASVPLCHDTVYLDASSGAGTYTADMPRLGADIDCTGFTRTLTTSTAASVYGSLTLASGMTLTASIETYTFRGRGTHTIDTSNKTLSKSLVFYSYGGTYTLQSDLTITGSLNTYSGTFDANDFNVTAKSYYLVGSVLYMGSGVFDVTTEYFNDFTTTTYCETSTILFSGTSTIYRELYASNGKTFYKLKFSGSGVNTYYIYTTSTYNTIESDKTDAFTIIFGAGKTITTENWGISGSSGNVVTINSTTTGTHALTKSGGGQVRSDYLNIQHSIATPSNTWYAGVNSTDNQSTATAGSGWLFTVPLPTCTTQAVSSISDLTATGNGTITDDGSGILSERGFVWSTTTQSDPGNVAPASTSYSNYVSSSGTFSEGAFTGNITGLSELTTYYVRSYCKNEAGYDYGTEVSFTTLETPAAPVVTTQAVSDVEGTTATGNGTITDDNGQTVTKRGFVYSITSHSNPGNKSPAASDYEGDASDTGTFTEEAYTKSITGLAINTTYYVRAYAQNSVGYGYGNEVSFLTDRLPTVTAQNATNRQSNTATLNGTITDAGGQDVIKVGFVWDIATQSNPGNVAPASSGYSDTQSTTGTFSESSFSEAITGLSENTTYYVRSFAQNSIGYSYSDEITFTTVRYPGLTSIVNSDTNSISVTDTETPTEVVIINSNTNSTTIQNGT